MAFVDIIETLLIDIFAGEALNDAHAGDVLIEHRVDARDSQPHLAVALACPCAPFRSQNSHQRHDNESQE